MNNAILSEIGDERRRQDSIWGQQNHLNGTGRPGSRELADHYRAICKANDPTQENWQDILSEEVFEAFAETDPSRLRAELVQVAAVAVAWIEAIDRRRAGPSYRAFLGERPCSDPKCECHPKTKER